METLEGLRRQIRASEDLQSVVTTMKSLAAVNIRQYEEAARSLVHYSRTIELGFTVLLHRDSGALALSAPEEHGPAAAIAVGSDQGMCGPFNQQMARHVATHFDPPEAPDAEPLILAVGVRLVAELQAAGHRIDEALPLPDSAAGITDRVQDLIFHIDTWRRERGVGRVWVFHHRPREGASYEPNHLQLVPIDLNWLRSLREKPWPTRMLPAFTMDRRRLFSSLAEQHLFIGLFRALADSAAAENAARLAAMQSAEENIEERLEDLTARYNRRRQSTITEELLDVIAGFEILEAG